MEKLPADFIAILTAPDPQGLICALDSTPPVSIRLNPRKPLHHDGTLVEWCSQGRYLDSRPIFTADPALHGGAYYVQEASSMFAGWLTEKLLDTNRITNALDLCAAPGGKSTHLSALLGPEAVLVANEVIRQRARVLSENVQKWGAGNTVVTNADPREFGERLPAFFDLMLIDAPCSGEGMFRKDPAARSEWSPEGVELCAARARRIVSDAWPTLRDGGALVFSTCTFNESENDLNVEWIARELGGEVMTDFGELPEGITHTRRGFQFYPHLVRGEGFYAAVIIKGSTQGYVPRVRANGKSPLTPLGKSEAQPVARWVGPQSAITSFAMGGGQLYGFSERLYEAVPLLLERLHVLYSGVLMGDMIRTELKPSHPLALYCDLDRSALNIAELDTEQAMEYLRKGVGPSPELFAQGLNLVTHDSVALGWIKRIGARCNNLYPAPWRVINY